MRPELTKNALIVRQTEKVSFTRYLESFET